MSDLIPLPPSGLINSRVSRAGTREAVRARAHVQALAAVEIARVEAIEDIATSGLIATSNIAAIEQALIGRVPAAQVRIQHLGDVAAAAIANLVLGASGRV